MLLTMGSTNRIVFGWLGALTAGLMLLFAVLSADAQSQEDPMVNFHFGLDCNGQIIGFFSSVSGIGSESEVVEHKVVDNKGTEIIRKIPGRLRWLDITLKRGITSSLEIWQWRQLVNEGDINAARKNCSITMLDQAAQAVARWNIINVWPVKVSGPVGNSSSEIMLEELVLVHEGMAREQ